MVRPLSTDGKTPARRDLSGYWNKVKRAIRGLGSNIKPEYFTNDHIHLVGPIILGDAAYELI
jgi:hypothetical protein